MIPLTDSEHSLLPLHFAVDPGADFCWNRDEFDAGVAADMEVDLQDRINMLNTYLEVKKDNAGARRTMSLVT